MAGDERRAEIEAVARALTDWPDEWDEHDEGDKDVFRRMAADGIVALDRVRDARGDDEDSYPIGHPDVNPTRCPSPQVEDHEAYPRGTTSPCTPFPEAGKLGSPQVEDHEEGLNDERRP